jgi:AraC-like DNA-binding protein
MITGCVDQIYRDSCAGCERRDPCHDLLGMIGLWPDRSSLKPPGRRSPFMAFLGEVTKAIQERAELKPSPLQREIEQRLEPMLAAGPVRIDEVARALGYGRQTLYRRLKAEGVTFEQILDRLRRRLATRFLREGLSVKETAYRLGFSDPAAFSRAFKRWTGGSPSAVSRDS